MDKNLFRRVCPDFVRHVGEILDELLRGTTQEGSAAAKGTDAEILAKFRGIRDQIEERVFALLSERLGKMSPGRKTGAGK